MADTNSFVGEAYNIPYGGIGSGEAMQYTANRQLQDQQARQSEQARLAQQAAKAAEDQDKNWLANQKESVAFAEQYGKNPTRNLDVNKIIDANITNMLGQLKGDERKLSTPEFYSKLQEIKKGMAGLDAMKRAYQTNEQEFADWIKENPNVDVNDARAHFDDIFKSNVLMDDGSGNLTVNPNGKMPDIKTELSNPSSLKYMKVDASKMYDVLGNPNINESKSITSGTTGKGGKMFSEKVEITRTPFHSDKPRKNADGSYSLDLDFDIVHGVKVPKPQMMEVVMGDPRSRIPIQKAWEEEKDRMRQLGKVVDPKNEELLFQGFVYDRYNKSAPSRVQSAKKDTQNIVVNTGTGSGSRDGKQTDVEKFNNEGFGLQDFKENSYSAKNGILYDKNKQKVTDIIYLPIKRINTTAATAKKASMGDNVDFVHPKTSSDPFADVNKNLVIVHVENGKIVGIETTGGLMTRGEKNAAYQKGVGVPTKQRNYNTPNPTKSNQAPPSKPTSTPNSKLKSIPGF